MKETFSRFKISTTNKITNIKNRIQKSSLEFKIFFKFLGFITILGIFGVTLIALILAAVSKPGEV